MLLLIFCEEFCTVQFSNIAQKPLAEIISIYGLGSLAMRQLKSIKNMSGCLTVIGKIFYDCRNLALHYNIACSLKSVSEEEENNCFLCAVV